MEKETIIKLLKDIIEYYQIKNKKIFINLKKNEKKILFNLKIFFILLIFWHFKKKLKNIIKALTLAKKKKIIVK
jgi:hypothetical protein